MLISRGNLHVVSGRVPFIVTIADRERGAGLVVQVYDITSGSTFDPLGQFVAEYHVETFLAADSTRGLDLYGGVAEWSLTPEALAIAQAWVRRELASRTCRHCGRSVTYVSGDGWVDAEATGDDVVWRQTCDAHDTFIAEHEPEA